MIYIYLLFPLIINIGFTIWVFVDAKKKDYETIYAYLWALGTFWFGPFAFAIWLFVRNKEFGEDLLTCPSCREYYTGERVVCPHCGYALQGGIVDMSAQDPMFDYYNQDTKEEKN
jgi:hypothetical protein